MTKIHTVKQGETLSGIAKQYGFARWETIYDYPENAEFREKRENPDVLYPGDEIAIPEKRTKEIPCESGRTHTFKAKVQKTLLRIAVKDEKGEAIAGKKYQLKLGNTKVHEGATDNGGLAEERIPERAEKGELIVWPDDADPKTKYVWPLLIGHLDPVEHLTGVQARLNNLGFDCGPVDGINGPRTRGAVKAFQEEHKLTVDGIPGPQTQGKLKEVHGC